MGLWSIHDPLHHTQVCQESEKSTNIMTTIKTLSNQCNDHSNKDSNIHGIELFSSHSVRQQILKSPFVDKLFQRELAGYFKLWMLINESDLNKPDIFLKHAIELHNFQTTGWKLVKWGNSIAKNKTHRDKMKSWKQIMYTQEKPELAPPCNWWRSFEENNTSVAYTGHTPFINPHKRKQICLAEDRMKTCIWWVKTFIH